MTLAGFTFPAVPSLTVWQRTLRHPQRLWAGTLRIWQTELAIASPTDTLVPFLQRSGMSLEEAAQRYGLYLPNGEKRVTRSTVNFVDLPNGPIRVELKGLFLPGWPTPLEPSEVPAALHQPQATGGMPLLADDWHTVPVVRALAFMGAAALVNDSISVYALKPSAGTIVPEPLFQLPANVLPTATDAEWRSAWQMWCAGKRLTNTEPMPGVANGLAIIPPSHPLKANIENNQEAWLFAGSGSFHEIARLQVA
jgi:hypothetical protein